MNFAIYYNDNAFLRAARTWKSNLKGGECTLIGITYAFELVSAFRQLKSSGVPISRGALFVHASEPGFAGLAAKGGVHFAISGCTIDDVNKAAQYGMQDLSYVDTAYVGIIRKLEKLDWEKDALLELYGCMTGYAAPGNPSLAEVFAKSQGVRTTGQAGKAYFSRNRETYEEISANDSTVYLRAFYRWRNIIIDLLDGGMMSSTKWPNRAIPEIAFSPK